MRAAAGRAPAWRRLALLVLLAALCAALVALGNWQLARRSWKLDLIARVERQLAAAPVAAPGPSDWAHLGRDDEYRRLRVTGTFDHARETCTQAVTVHGAGCWVMTPLQTADGWWLLVNRGFIDPEHRDPASRAAGQPAGTVTVPGLLRLSEPGGGFLRRNDPAAGRWTSRDVAAIAAARGLPADRVAPYFLDADASVPEGPIGGLTVVQFRNAHLAYALTWFALAALVLAGMVLVVRRGRDDDSAP